MEEKYFIYLLTNADGSRIYTGITSDLIRRVRQHRSGLGGRYTRAFQVYKLVYYETCEGRNQALKREMQIKRGGRKKKIELIEKMNKDGQDLFDDLAQSNPSSTRIQNPR